MRRQIEPHAKLEKAEGSSRKVLRALLAFSITTPRHTAETLASEIGAPLSSTYRYLAILREARLVEDDGRGSVVLAPRVIGLAQAARAGTDLASVARPFMKLLSRETGETVILIRRSGDRAICIERAEPTSRIRLTFDVGTALPLHRGAGPKLLLAHLPATDCNAILNAVVASQPAFSLQRKQLLNELVTIRKNGWSEARSEITPDVYAIAVGIVDVGGLAAALSIVAPLFRTPRPMQLSMRKALQKTAANIANAYSSVTI